MVFTRSASSPLTQPLSLWERGFIGKALWESGFSEQVFLRFRAIGVDEAGEAHTHKAVTRTARQLYTPAQFAGNVRKLLQ